MQNGSLGGYSSDFWAAKVVQLILALGAFWIVMQIESVVSDPLRTDSNTSWYIIAFVVAMVGVISFGYFLLHWDKPKIDPLSKRRAQRNRVAKDDLTKIEGIGPDISEMLASAGYTTYEALATARPKDLKAALDKIDVSFRVHNTKTWPQQAGLAAQGEWDELAKLQDQLLGGREK